MEQKPLAVSAWTVVNGQWQNHSLLKTKLNPQSQIWSAILEIFQESQAMELLDLKFKVGGGGGESNLQSNFLHWLCAVSVWVDLETLTD